MADHLTASSPDDDLLDATNAAAILIADEVTATTPVVLIGAGPRVHLYTVHGQDATSGHNVNEAAIPNLVFSGDWMLYLPDHPYEPGLIDSLVSNPRICIGDPPTTAAAPSSQRIDGGKSRVGAIDLGALEAR
jgi:hypothetical protein